MFALFLFICAECDNTCYACQDPGTSNDCLACTGSRYLFGNSCVTDCFANDAQTYANPTDHQCHCTSHYFCCQCVVCNLIVFAACADYNGVDVCHTCTFYVPATHV